jgi:hypothetical protein
MHFTEHLVDAFRKSSQEYNLNCKTSSFSIWQLKNKIGLHLQQSTQESENSKTVNEGEKHSPEWIQHCARERVKRPGASAARRGRWQPRWTTGGPKTEIEASQSRPALSLFSRALSGGTMNRREKSKAGLALARGKIKSHVLLEKQIEPGQHRHRPNRTFPKA